MILSLNTEASTDFGDLCALPKSILWFLAGLPYRMLTANWVEPSEGTTTETTGNAQRLYISPKKLQNQKRNILLLILHTTTYYEFDLA